jgi:hypothetical protein
VPADLNLRPGEVHPDDPQVAKAMKVYDTLTPREQRETFRSTYRAAVAFERTGDVAHLNRSADSLTTTILLHGHPPTRQAILDAPTEPSPAENLRDVGALIEKLRA